MELVTASDLFVTASLAILLSILVAKLVSMAMATDTHTHNNTQQQPVITLQQERLTVQKPQSETRVELLSPIQVSTNVKTEQNREEETKVESNVVELKVTPEDIAVEVEVSNVGVFIEEHVAEEEEVTEINDEREQLGPQVLEDCKEQRKTERVEDCEEQRKTENVEDCEEERKIECVEGEEQRKTECVEDCEEQRKTEEITAKPVNDDDDDDDDWEGIERSELEKLFMSAAEFVGGEGGDGLGSEVRMELYGLHKVATEGPCREPQPMPLKLSARAKWYKFLSNFS